MLLLFLQNKGVKSLQFEFFFIFSKKIIRGTNDNI